MRLLWAADRTASAWKNGGGVTYEIAAQPPGAGLGDFDWRISIAEVAAGGPFSAFPDVDRVLTVIAGAGLRLRIGDAAVELDDAGPPHAFAGDAACEATLLAGPIRDLNVMVRRGVFRADVQRLAGGETITATADETLLVALESLDAGSARLSAEDAVILSPGARVLPTGAAVLVELSRV